MKTPFKEYVCALFSRIFWRYFWQEFKMQLPVALKREFISRRFANFMIAIFFILCVLDAMYQSYVKFVVDGIVGVIWIVNRGFIIEREKREKEQEEKQ